MNAALLFSLCESLVIITFTGAQAQDFVLGVRRSENAITLTCTDRLTGNTPIPDPQFFRGAAGMQRVRVDIQNGFTRNGNELTFGITRELEGEYTCGTTNVQSNAQALIGEKVYLQKDFTKKNLTTIVVFYRFLFPSFPPPSLPLSESLTTCACLYSLMYL
jgi:hypothetical protein